ncbi:MAG: HDOD domain-containing protein [bacterium]
MTKGEIQSIENIIGQVQSLPTLPSLALEVMMMAENPESSLADIALILQKDPAIASKILKIANSAFYGYSRQVTNLQNALLLLGLREVKTIVLGVSIVNLFKSSNSEVGYNHQLLWLHSAAVAQIARSLAFKASLFDLEQEAFTVGLIHDIGKIVLDQFRHHDFLKIIHLVQKEGNLTFLEAENRILGVNHAQIGGWLAQKWLFPSDLAEAIEYHHNPQESKHGHLLASLAHIADIFCKAKDLSFVEVLKGESITDNGGWKIIQENSPGGGLHFDIERFTFGLDEEISKAQEFITISRGMAI